MLRRCLWVCGMLAALGWAGTAEAQQYTRVSVSTGGTTANGASSGAVFSGDGKIVAFSSAADNLVTPDANASGDVFVRDLTTNITTRVSVTSDGNERTGPSGITAPNTGAMFLGPNVSLNQDGSVVAFTTRAPLDAADTNTCNGLVCPDVYVRDRTLNQTSRISVASDNSQANGESGDPHVSGNGRFVIFTSAATNLVPGDNNGMLDVFIRDRTTLTTTRVSVSPSGNDLTAPSYSGRISADGQIVAFVSQGQVVTTADPISCFTGSPTCARAYVLDRASGTVVRVPLPPVSVFPSGATVDSVDITPDGRFVAVASDSLVPGLGPGSSTVLSVYDRQTGRVQLESKSVGFQLGGVVISSDGRFVSIGGGATTSLPAPSIAVDRLDLTGILATELPAEHVNTNFPAIRFSPTGLKMLFNSNTSHDGGDANGVDDIYILNRDLDNDGMPDAWETKFGLNPNDSGDATLDPDGDGVTNLQEYQNATNPKGTFKRYFAEGAANAFFTTRLALFNPGDQTATVTVEFLGANSQTRTETLTLAAHGWTAINMNDTTADQPDESFSTVIDANQQVIADRTMTWDKTGYGSHAETAIEAPGMTWYLAEGSTGGSFDLFYLLQNPNTTTANVTVNYLRPAPLAPIVKTYTVAPRTRRTIYVDTEDPQLVATDVSAKITSDQPILAERAMYFSTPTQPFAAGHEGAAVEAPATNWFLAEGATGSFFDLFLLLANAETTDAQVKVTYLLSIGAPVIKNYVVPAQSRLTINVDFEDPRLVNAAVSTIVESTNAVPVIAERAMWWPSPNWYEAHLSAGSTTTGTKWALADGLVTNTAGSETETYVLIANTSSTAGSADVTLYYADGTVKTKNFPLAANSRFNVQISQEFPESIGKGGFGTVIQSSGPALVVERAMYTNANGQVWAAGSDALATKLQ